ncbi:MAG: alpha/beta hydrolase [Armatimonadetes bacterium]|nr:alpha/beta hydrolase [Armatimonadota bacterium]
MSKLSTFAIGFAAAAAAVCSCGGEETPASEPGNEITFKAADGATVYADLFEAEGGKEAPVILLFHQAGSNAGEYATIAPRLVKMGFNCLAVDLRSGGKGWGRQNRTVEALGRSEEYMDAYQDMQAALSYAKDEGYTGGVLIWGSSYSASLAIRLGGDRADDVAAVLAFSPGEYFGSGDPVRKWASSVAAPIFVTSGGGGEVDVAREILNAASPGQRTHHIPKKGVHGSSTLRSDKNSDGAEENWAAVERFLSGFKPGGQDSGPESANL